MYVESGGSSLSFRHIIPSCTISVFNLTKHRQITVYCSFTVRWLRIKGAHIVTDGTYTSKSSTRRFSAFELMKLRRGATASPIRILSV